MIDIKNYNRDNVFAKILRKEIPSDLVFEDENVYAFKDINPQAPVHVLIIPKRDFCSLDDFASEADNKISLAFLRSIPKIAKKLKLEDGYRVVSNIGSHGGQEVPHFHIHLLGGQKFTSIIK